MELKTIGGAALVGLGGLGALGGALGIIGGVLNTVSPDAESSSMAAPLIVSGLVGAVIGTAMVYGGLALIGEK